jgi:hypothetical protein
MVVNRTKCPRAQVCTRRTAITVKTVTHHDRIWLRASEGVWERGEAYDKKKTQLKPSINLRREHQMWG